MHSYTGYYVLLKCFPQFHLFSSPQPWFLRVIVINSPPTPSTGREKHTLMLWQAVKELLVRNDEQTWRRSFTLKFFPSGLMILTHFVQLSAGEIYPVLMWTHNAAARLLIHSRRCCCITPIPAARLFLPVASSTDYLMLLLVFRHFLSLASTSNSLSPYKSKCSLRSWPLILEILNYSILILTLMYVHCRVMLELF